MPSAYGPNFVGYRSEIGVPFEAHGPIFYLSYCAMTTQQATYHCWITSL